MLIASAAWLKDQSGAEKVLPAYEAVRTESHKYVEYVNGERELYDFEDDPYELENVYESTDPSLNENLKTKLDTLRNCAKAECREDEATP